MRCTVFFALLVILTSASSTAQAVQSYKGLQVSGHYGFIFAHSQAVQNTAGARPWGVELETIKQRVDTAAWNLCHCYPIKGWSFSYFDYNTRILGHAATGAYFLEPAYRVGANGQFRFRGSVGLSYLTNPYHPDRNPTNLSYSSRLSGFLRLGVGGSYQLNSKLLLLTSVQYQHVSNGGWKEPNKGINWPTASVGVSYFRPPYQLPTHKQQATVQTGRKPFIEAGLFFSAKQGFQPGGGSARTPLAGVMVQAEKQVAAINAINTGLEIYYDNALAQQLKKDSISGSGTRIGLMAGHDFLLGKFFFSQQLGVYLLNKSPYYKRLYHRWALRYKLNGGWLVGLGLNAHVQVADFFDLRLLYRL